MNRLNMTRCKTMVKAEKEIALELRCVEKIERLGGSALKLALAGARGFPDRTVLMPGGQVSFYEFKRQKVGVVSAQQAVWRRLLTLLGFGVYLIDSDADFDRALARELER
jgi:hypothetical protein